MPRVCEWAGERPHRSGLIQSLRGSNDVPNGLTIEMYAGGLSVRDVEDGLRDAARRPLLSCDAVSKRSETLREGYKEAVYNL